MATMQIRAFHDLDSQSQDGAETPRGHRYENTLGNVSTVKLVFAEPERGLPSLRRGWRTPDPSPDRTGLPKCAPYAEYLEETEEALDVHGRGRQTDAHTAVRLQTPSPPPVADFRMDSYVKHVAQAFRASWADQSEETDEEEALEVHARGRSMEAHAAVRLQTPSPQPQAIPDFHMDAYMKNVAQAFRDSWADQSEETTEAESPGEADSPADSEQKPMLSVWPSSNSFWVPFVGDVQANQAGDEAVELRVKEPLDRDFVLARVLNSDNGAAWPGLSGSGWQFEMVPRIVVKTALKATLGVGFVQGKPATQAEAIAIHLVRTTPRAGLAFIDVSLEACALFEEAVGEQVQPSAMLAVFLRAVFFSCIPVIMITGPAQAAERPPEEPLCRSEDLEDADIRAEVASAVEKECSELEVPSPKRRCHDRSSEVSAFWSISLLIETAGDLAAAVAKAPVEWAKALCDDLDRGQAVILYGVAADGELLHLASHVQLGDHVRLAAWGAPPLLATPGLPRFQVSARSRSSITAEARLHALVLQNGWLADDRMAHGLLGLALSEGRQVTVVDPLDMAAAVQASRPEAVLPALEMSKATGTVISALAIEGHWVTLCWMACPPRVHAWASVPMSATTGPFAEGVSQANWAIARASGSGVASFDCEGGPERPPLPGQCGSLALLDLHHHLRGLLPDHRRDQVFVQACANAFRAEVSASCWVRPPCVLAGTVPALLEHGLAGVLRDKGVPEAMIQSRVQAAIQRVGRGPLQSALQGANQWRSLKAVCSNVTPPFQLVLPDELQGLIATKAAAGEEIGPKRKTKAKKPPAAEHPTWIMPQPEQVTVAPGVFAQDGHALKQLSATDIGPQAKGVVVMAGPAVLPYLRINQPVSQQALGILVLGDLDLQGTHLKHELVRFQATCGPCKEPALLSATLLQIGDRYVQKVQPDSRLTLDIVPSAIVRLAVYRDQWPEDWSSLVKKPLRSVLEVCALLQTCDSAGCTCSKWHGTSSPGVPEAVLEVWGRASGSFRACKPEDAAVFNAFLRVPVALGPLLLGYSGEAGVYFEPRGQEARQNSVDYNVFWMPKASYHDALVFKQTHADVVGLARVGQRFGVRCAKDNTAALHAILRPTTPYMAMEGALTFHAGPWPYGTQRATIVKAFKEWKWEARPMQPIPRPSGSGLWWAVAAREHPPQAILYVQQGEVLISEVKSKATPKVQAQAPVVAAKAAMQALSVVPPAGEDPLQINDPWAAALPAKLPRPVAVPAPPFDVKSFEDKLQAQITAQVTTQVAAATQSVEGRVAALETSVAEVNTRVQGQESRLRDAFQELFNEQTERLELLLGAKRARNEIQVASFLVGALSILGAVAYGYPTAPSATSCLLDAITDRIVHRGEGPRFIAGDFNLQPQALQHAREWANHGFIDVQDIWHQRTGCIPKVTCKNATRKDYLFVSAELLPLLQAVEVDPTWFCDHSALLATFQVRGLSVPSPIWRMPRQRKFSPQVVQAMEQGGFQTVPVVGDSAAVYRKIWQEFETRASQALRGCGQAALRPAEVGRGQTSDITMIKAFQGQVAVGRAGEVKPGFFGKDRLYCQWFRQLRRLQALVQALGREATTDNATLYRAGLWHAIQNAPGFKPSFVAWWPKRDVCLPEDPVQLALGLPGPVVARQIFLSFQANVQDLEKRLSKQRKVDARQRRVQSPALIFKDLQKAAAQPVQTIVQSVKAKVVEVRHDEAALVLDSAPRWHEGEGFFINGRPLQVHQVADDALWGETEEVNVGDIVSQQRVVADLPGLFSVFGAEWLQRWMKHEHIEPNRWSAIIDAFPENPVQPYALASITVPAWRAAIQGKHARSATGLDGVSRGDLLALPTDLTDSVIGLCARAEGSGDWAPQLLDARISALEKVVGAAEVTQFRPICVLPMAYRTWSSIRAKEALRHLSKVAPANLFGNLPGRSAGGVWYGLQMAIEQAQIEGRPLVGALLDLSKAFNTLPRAPVFAIGLRLGLPRGLINAWSGAVAKLSRRFQIRGATGPALPSATGFPEGCALSCVAMAIVDFALHVFVGSSSSPDVLSTFVDDWQLMGNDGPEVQRALKAVEDFVQSWDLAMDPTKTIHWATHPVQRRELRRGGVQVALSCRNLGGNMAFTRRRSASTISERIQALEGLWPKLSASCAPLKQKINALMVAAWPRALHGISTVTLCDAAFAGLRAGAARGLGLDRPGLNSKVLLSLVCHPLADPQFFAIASTFKDLRAFADPGAFSLLVSQVLKVEGRWTPGPAQAFLERCHSIGLSWDVERGLLQDGISTFDPWKVAPQELGLRLAFAWQVRVGQELEARPGFQGLSRADPGLKASFRKLASEQQSLVLILAQSGAFFTQDALHHFSTDPLDTATCKYCDCRDSVHHRLWECPGFAECREKHAGWALPDPATTQPALALRGWALRPERQVDLWRALHAIPDGTYDMDWPSSLPDSLDLFTDGSCFLPTLPQIRLASWAVTLAAPVGITPWILCSGPLRGILQTAFRAEITAVIAALRVALVSKRVVRIWSDCAGVVKRLRAAGKGQLVVRSSLPNCDLWSEVVALVERIQTPWSIHKVAAHEDL
ncbi:unnamed protein product [Symbiodinium sp. CCMP2592]|nr:unnamed protein product [Symbiodinium sp. CCMP2592]